VFIDVSVYVHTVSVYVVLCNSKREKDLRAKSALTDSCTHERSLASFCSLVSAVVGGTSYMRRRFVRPARASRKRYCSVTVCDQAKIYVVV
jgi:hypothetical protein